jgi:hypothetical protein
LLLAMVGMSQAAESGTSITVLFYSYTGVSRPILARAEREDLPRHWHLDRVGGMSRQPCVQSAPWSEKPGTPAALCIDGYNKHARVEAAALGFVRNPLDGSPGGQANVIWERVQVLAVKHEQAVAVLLGHSMAHELGHLLGLRRHSASGLMHDPWSSTELDWAARGGLTFLAAEAEAIRSRLIAAAQAPGDPVKQARASAANGWRRFAGWTGSGSARDCTLSWGESERGAVSIQPLRPTNLS